MNARDIAALALTERLGAYAGECLAGATQAVELGELLKAAFLRGALVLVERERRRAQRVRAIGAKSDVGVARIVGNAAEVYTAGAVEVGVFDLVDGGDGAIRVGVAGVGRGGLGAIVGVRAAFGVRGACRSRFESGDQIGLVFGAARAFILLLGQSRRLLIALRRQQLGRPVERSRKQRKPQHHGGADGKNLLVGGLARHGGSWLDGWESISLAGAAEGRSIEQILKIWGKHPDSFVPHKLAVEWFLFCLQGDRGS